MELPESVRSRFGEICWAQGGSGYGWWPSLIYDPCRAGEPATRTQARRFLGVRFLVYFIECPESPFSLLESAQIKNWTEGLSEDLHLGKAAKNSGKTKLLAFQRALLTATLLNEKPLEERLMFSNDNDDEPEMFTRQTRSQRAKLANGSPRAAFEPVGAFTNNKKRPIDVEAPAAKRPSPNHPVPAIEAQVGSELATKQNKRRVVGGGDEEGDEMVCKIVLKASQGRKERNIGIVVLPSKATSTFADVRQKIEEDLLGDLLRSDVVWKFFLMDPGVPISGRQETGLGSVYKLLSKARNSTLIEGTLLDPVPIYISDKHN